METKYSLKDDFNKGVELLTYHWGQYKYNSKMREVIQAYKTEMLQWFEQDSVEQENQIQHATQGLWYSLYLEKKRLEHRGCKMQYKFGEYVRDHALDNQEDTFVYKKDGKYTMCQAGQFSNVEKQYLRDGIVLGKEKQNRKLTYYILRSQTENGQYICPGCGAEQNLDKLLDGCDYCQSKFDVSAYEDKVVSVVNGQGTFDDREMDGFQNYSYVVGASLILIGLTLAMFTCGLSLLLAVYGITEINKGRNSKTVKRSADSKQISLNTKNRIKSHDPGFSEEEFVGALDCKLKSIHYASNAQELAAFVKCDVEPYVKAYQDIINCETGKLAYKEFRIEGNYQYVKIHRQIDIKRDCGNQLAHGEGIVAVTLAKKLATKLKNEVSLYRCNGCGATISLVEGGKCKYCGNEMDYAAYDWVVVGYQHVDEL